MRSWKSTRCWRTAAGDAAEAETAEHEGWLEGDASDGAAGAEV